MKNIFLLMLASLSILSTGIFGNDILTKDLIKQMCSVDDSCILSIKESRCYLNADRIYIVDNGIYLESDCFGTLALSNLMQDSQGMYTVGVYYIYVCDKCGRFYNSQPEECGTCGGTSFTLIDQLPD